MGTHRLPRKDDGDCASASTMDGRHAVNHASVLAACDPSHEDYDPAGNDEDGHGVVEGMVAAMDGCAVSVAAVTALMGNLPVGDTYVPVYVDPSLDLAGRCHGYPLQITLRHPDDRVMFHEAMHAVLSLDPQRVCVVGDDRHEDLVRWLTSTLFDQLGCRIETAP